MQTSTSQKSRTVSSWLLTGMWIKQKRSHLWHLTVMYCGDGSKFVPSHHLTNVCGTIGSLRNDDDDGNENGKKSNRFRQAKQQLCTCITLFCTFLCCRCTTTTWSYLISRFVEDGEQKTTFFFFSWTLMQSFRFQLQKNFGNIRRIKRDGISAIKFEAAQIQFLSDVFVAVAIVVAWNK